MKTTGLPGEAAVFHQEQAVIQQAQATLADPNFRQTTWAEPFALLLQSYEKLWSQTQRIMRMSDRFQGQLHEARLAEQRAAAVAAASEERYRFAGRIHRGFHLGP